MTYPHFLIGYFFLLYLALKASAWFNLKSATGYPFSHFLFSTPVLSPLTVNVSRAHPLLWPEIVRLILCSIFLSCFIFLAKNIFSSRNYLELIYLAPMIYFFTELLGTSGRLVYRTSKLKAPPIHDHPLHSNSLTEFWSLRWNTWVQDWLRNHVRWLPKKALPRLFFSFFLSGVFHEALVNFPYMIFFKKIYLGNMLFYFMLQAVGVWMERKWLRSTPGWLKRSFCWMMVLGPSPYFLGKPVLVIFGIIDG